MRSSEVGAGYRESCAPHYPAPQMSEAKMIDHLEAIVHARIADGSPDH